MDGDGWNNVLEVSAGSDPSNPNDSDSVQNTIAVIISNHNALSDQITDTDADGISDALESVLGGDPNDASNSGMMTQLSNYIVDQIGKNVPAMGGVGIFLLALSMLGLGAVRTRGK